MSELQYKQSRLLKLLLDKLDEELSNSKEMMAKILGKTMKTMKGDMVERMEKSEKMRIDFDQFIEKIKAEIESYQKE